MDRNRKDFLNDMKYGLGTMIDQSKKISGALFETSNKIDDISNDSNIYKKEISMSSEEIKKFKINQKYEKYLFYFSITFFFICLGIIIFRRIPIMIVFRYFIVIFQMVINFFK